MSEEEIAEAFLSARAFRCDHDLTWLGDGLRPDFFCQGPLDLWVEVKTLRSSDAAHDHVYQIWDYLRQRTQADKTIGEGWSMAFISQDATQRDAKASLALARHAFTLPEMKAVRDTYVIIPDEPIYGSRVRFTAMSREGQSLFVCSRCEIGVYGVPFAFQPHPWDQRIQVWNEGTAEPARPHHEVIRDGAYRLALRIFPDTCNFRVSSSMRAEGATRSTTVDRLRNAIKTAAKQLKRGVAARPGPGAIFVNHSGILVAEERELFSAMFGDLQYSFGPGQLQSGALHYGPNGAINAGQHRCVSALTYFPNNAKPTTIHNPWAHTPLPRGIFGGREWIPESEDRFNLIEHDH
jgi:hypothetical protein